MDLDFSTLENLRRNHPAWRLLLADHAPLVITFLHKVYVRENQRSIAQTQLVSDLEDELFELRQGRSPDSFPKSAAEYLDDWAQDSRGWLRKYYPLGSDEPHFDLTPPTEKAMAWLESLSARSFVGTESRLRTVVELLRQIVQGSVSDPALRIRQLEQQKTEINHQIRKIHQGAVDMMDETATRERFQHLTATARELLADFREVEQNFRNLDRQTRERIAGWEGAKAALLEDILGERDVINDSDQGKSFRSFWDFLMSPERQEELSQLLDAVFAMPAVQSLKPDARLLRVHYDWLEAGESTQRTVALLSRQLRRFLDDQLWLENRRIMEILRQIESSAIAVRNQPPEGDFMEIAASAADIELPMERPLFNPPLQTIISQSALLDEAADIPADALFNQRVVDPELLRSRINQALIQHDQISLADLLLAFPLEQGLAELVVYLSLATTNPLVLIDDSVMDQVAWQNAGEPSRRAELPRIIFVREPMHVST